MPNEQGLEYARRKGIDPHAQLVAMRNWAERKKAMKADWLGTWRNWIDNHAEDLARRTGKTAPAVLWKDCAPEQQAKQVAKGQDPALLERLRVVREWTDRSDLRCPPPPAWLGTPAARSMKLAVMLEQLDAWIGETAKRNGLRAPRFGASPPMLAAAE